MPAPSRSEPRPRHSSAVPRQEDICLEAGGAQYFLAWLLALVQMVFAVAVAVWVMSWPTVFSALYPLTSGAAYGQDARAVIQWMETNHRERSLASAMTQGRLTPKELRHFSDVRRALQKLPVVAAVLGFATLLLFGLAPRSRLFLEASQKRAWLLWGVLVLGAGGLAYWDWRWLYAALHEPLFGPTSWRFPRGSYSLVLFPSNLWKALGVLALGFPVLFLGAGELALRLSARSARYGGSDG